MRHVAPVLIALATLTGCDAAAGLVSAVGVPGPTVRVSGKLYAPAAQISMVAAGGGNYVVLGFGLATVSGEAAAGNAKLSVKPWSGMGLSTPVTTGSAGEFALDLAGNTVYQATTDNGAMPSVLVVGSAASTVELDAANHMVAAKLLTSGKTPTADAITSGIAKLRGILTSAPNTVSRAELSAAFDKDANADVKTILGL